MSSGIIFTRSKSWFLRFFFCYVVLFISSFSFPHRLLPDIGSWFSPFYGELAAFTGLHVFGISSPWTAELISDSTGFYLHAFNLIFISSALAFAWFFLDRSKKHDLNILVLLQTLVRYYLALQMLEYGFNKIFKWQFYLPEPNTLYTTVGETPRDLLYWSSMGSSYTYTFFSGAIEVIAALLLLFRRTSLLGAVVTLGIMINVLMINLGFDISVKLYSSFLILLCCILLAPDAKRLFVFFFTGKSAARILMPSLFSGKPQWFYAAAKVPVLLLIFSSTLIMYFESGNFNDDHYPRPGLHGAYEIRTDTPAANGWKRVFFHRRGYFITQDRNGQMQDYPFENDSIRQLLTMNDYDGNPQLVFHYEKRNDSLLLLDGFSGKTRMKLELHRLEPEKLPLLQNEFSWTVDE